MKAYQLLQERLYANIEAEEYEKLKGVEQGLNSLFVMRTRISAIPTWPWTPGTPRNFISTVFLPIFLLSIQQLLGRLF